MKPQFDKQYAKQLTEVQAACEFYFEGQLLQYAENVPQKLYNPLANQTSPANLVLLLNQQQLVDSSGCSGLANDRSHLMYNYYFKVKNIPLLNDFPTIY